MRIIKQRFIHNHIVFDEIEKDILTSACKIVSNVREINAHGYTEDDYLRNRCTEIMKGISELLDNYSNEYPDEEE